MERTNYVDKAKKLMLQAARTTALVIVPLAAAVSSAHAGSIALASSGSPVCTTSASGSFCFAGDSLEPDLGSGVQGLSFYTSGGFTQNLFVNSSGSTIPTTMSMGDSGVMGGTIAAGTLIPVSWNFNMTPLSGSGTISSWSLVFELGSTAGGSQFGSIGTSGGSIGSSGATIIGGPINLNVSSTILSGTTLFETVLLTMNLTNTNVGVQVTVPNASSWDFNSVAATGVPEPATTGLIGAGMAFFAALLRRRKK
jgi:hypothetical protein